MNLYYYYFEPTIIKSLFFFFKLLSINFFTGNKNTRVSIHKNIEFRVGKLVIPLADRPVVFASAVRTIKFVYYWDVFNYKTTLNFTITIYYLYQTRMTHIRVIMYSIVCFLFYIFFYRLSTANYYRNPSTRCRNGKKLRHRLNIHEIIVYSPITII